MDAFNKSYIENKIDELAKILRNHVETDLNQYRELFTNDFAFFMFTKCLADMNDTTAICKVTAKSTNNVFLFCNNFLFGVNDDGKIFCVYLNAKPTLKSIYSQLGYEIDVLDNIICNKLKFHDNMIVVNFTRKKVQTLIDKWVRICGDLRMRIMDYRFINYHFTKLLSLYINEAWMQRLSQYGIIVTTTGIPYALSGKSNIIKELGLNELINVLKSLNFEIISIESIESLDKIKVSCKIGNLDFVIFVHNDELSGGYVFDVHNNTSTQVKRLDFVKTVLNVISIDAKEQNIVTNFGNHKIILHGYYLPLVSVGTASISFDRFLVHKILFQHPEHHDVLVQFDDLVEVEFETLALPQQHQKLRNEYFANKIK
jgi:hypothetical protein